MPADLTRRGFLSAGLALAASRLLPAQLEGGGENLFADSSDMEPWQRGLLDIHHISTGRGNSVLIICPDGTSILIDAGAVKGPAEALAAAEPNSSRRPGEWIAQYALRHLSTAPRRELDYVVLTHFHGDHIGEVAQDCPVAPGG